MSNATASDWLESAERLAKADQRPGESFEQAFARVTASGQGAVFLKMHREPQGRIPAPVVVRYKGETETAEQELHRLAVAEAKASGESYEQSMSRLLATAKGAELWQRMRGA
jgi:hypothetical protein